VIGVDNSESALRGRFTMATVSGRVISFVEPKVADIELEDIACGLARVCRYSGQIRRFYSVAEHSVWCAQAAMARHGVETAQAALMHDAAEAYVGDMVRPLKMLLRSDGIASAYDEAEATFARVIGKRFGLVEGYDELPDVKAIDEACCAREQERLRVQPAGWKPHVPPLAFWPQCWDPLVAEVKFLETAKLLGVR
jgi:hypothetical protein